MLVTFQSCLQFLRFYQSQFFKKKKKKKIRLRYRASCRTSLCQYFLFQSSPAPGYLLLDHICTLVLVPETLLFLPLSYHLWWVRRYCLLVISFSWRKKMSGVGRGELLANNKHSLHLSTKWKQHKCACQFFPGKQKTKGKTTFGPVSLASYQVQKIGLKKITHFVPKMTTTKKQSSWKSVSHPPTLKKAIISRTSSNVNELC